MRKWILGFLTIITTLFNLQADESVCRQTSLSIVAKGASPSRANGELELKINTEGVARIVETDHWYPKLEIESASGHIDLNGIESSTTIRDETIEEAENFLGVVNEACELAFVNISEGDQSDGLEEHLAKISRALAEGICVDYEVPFEIADLFNYYTEMLTEFDFIKFDQQMEETDAKIDLTATAKCEYISMSLVDWAAKLDDEMDEEECFEAALEACVGIGRILSVNVEEKLMEIEESGRSEEEMMAAAKDLIAACRVGVEIDLSAQCECKENELQNKGKLDLMLHLFAEVCGQRGHLTVNVKYSGGPKN